MVVALFTSTDEGEESTFWAKHDSMDFVDWQAAQRVKFFNLEPSLRTISVRLPTGGKR